jgi:hypothetical protein
MRFAAALLACSLLAGQGTRPAPAAAKAAVKPKPETTAAKPVVEAAKVAEPEAAPKEPKGESLRFNVNWPSGLSLGEGELISTLEGGAWTFSFNVEAAIPGFAVAESGASRASADFCSLELNKKSKRGKRETEEQTIFDMKELKATRTTLTPKGGGKSEMQTPACARDALTFIRYLRRELAAGRLPASQQVYYGAPYQTRVQYKGTQEVRVGSEMVEADILTATIKGPATELSVDLFFARDQARTPLLAQIPVVVGKFTVEFIR